MKIIFKYIAAVILTLALICGGWWLERKVNYSLQYKTMVKETIREMVKDECLKGGS